MFSEWLVGKFKLIAMVILFVAMLVGPAIPPLGFVLILLAIFLY